MDLGTYERALDQDLTALNFSTSGQVYRRVLERERTGGYLGRDVQMIPHVTGEVKNHLRELAVATRADVVFVEIGGTVGDVENAYMIEAMRQLTKLPLQVQPPAHAGQNALRRRVAHRNPGLDEPRHLGHEERHHPLCDTREGLGAADGWADALELAGEPQQCPDVAHRRARLYADAPAAGKADGAADPPDTQRPCATTLLAGHKMQMPTVCAPQPLRLEVAEQHGMLTKLPQMQRGAGERRGRCSLRRGRALSSHRQASPAGVLSSTCSCSRARQIRSSISSARSRSGIPAKYSSSSGTIWKRQISRTISSSRPGRMK